MSKSYNTKLPRSLREEIEKIIAKVISENMGQDEMYDHILYGEPLCIYTDRLLLEYFNSMFYLDEVNDFGESPYPEYLSLYKEADAILANLQISKDIHDAISDEINI